MRNNDTRAVDSAIEKSSSQSLTNRIAFWISLILLTLLALWLTPWSYGEAHPERLYAVPAILLLLLPLFFCMKRGEHAPYWVKNRVWIKVLLLAFLYNLLGNIYTVPYRDMLVPNLLMTAGVMMILYALLRCWAVILWLPLILWGFIELYTYSQYGTAINSLVIAETLETSLVDAKAYLTFSFISYTVIALFVVIALFWLQVRLLRGEKKRTLCFQGVVLAAASCAIAALPQNIHGCMWPVHKMGYIYDSYQEALFSNEETVEEVKRLPSPALKPSESKILKGNEGVVVIVHVGESLLANRMSINGYKRKTTPELERMTGVVNFPYCIASAGSTSQAQLCILTNARRSIMSPDPAMQATCGSVFDLLRAQGFDLYSFYGSRVGHKLKYDMVMKKLSIGAKEQFYTTETFSESIGQLQDLLQRLEDDGDSATHNKLFFICNEGSHTPFYHYDKENPPFSPALDTFENPQLNGEEINNAYDSTVHFTDQFVARFVKELEGKPYFYLYVSDHGELLGENGAWGRGAIGYSEEAFLSGSAAHVGMFAICSPELEALHPHFAERVAQLQKNSQLIVAHEHIFHTVLGMVGIETPYYEEKLDLTHPNVEAYQGAHPLKKEEEK